MFGSGSEFEVRPITSAKVDCWIIIFAVHINIKFAEFIIKKAVNIVKEAVNIVKEAVNIVKQSVEVVNTVHIVVIKDLYILVDFLILD